MRESISSSFSPVVTYTSTSSYVYTGKIEQTNIIKKCFTYTHTHIDRLILKMACTRYNKSAFSHFVSDYTHMICICDLVYQILYFFYNKLAEAMSTCVINFGLALRLCVYTLYQHKEKL